MRKGLLCWGLCLIVILGVLAWPVMLYRNPGLMNSLCELVDGMKAFDLYEYLQETYSAIINPAEAAVYLHRSCARIYYLLEHPLLRRVMPVVRRLPGGVMHMWESWEQILETMP